MHRSRLSIPGASPGAVGAFSGARGAGQVARAILPFQTRGKAASVQQFLNAFGEESEGLYPRTKDKLNADFNQSPLLMYFKSLENGLN